jgi:hypothetical protein
MKRHSHSAAVIPAPAQADVVAKSVSASAGNDAVPPNTAAQIAARFDQRRRAGFRRLCGQTPSPAGFCKGREGELATAAELKQLAAIQARCDGFKAQLDKLGYDKPRAERLRRQTAYDADPTPENLAALAALDDRDSANEKMHRQMSPIKGAMRKAAAEATAIVKAIKERAAELCDAEIERLFFDSEKTCAMLGIDHVGNPLVGAFQNLADALRRPEGVCNTGPRLNLAGIIKI